MDRLYSIITVAKIYPRGSQSCCLSGLLETSLHFIQQRRGREVGARIFAIGNVQNEDARQRLDELSVNLNARVYSRNTDSNTVTGLEVLAQGKELECEDICSCIIRDGPQGGGDCKI